MKRLAAIGGRAQHVQRRRARRRRPSAGICQPARISDRMSRLVALSSTMSVRMSRSVARRRAAPVVGVLVHAELRDEMEPAALPGLALEPQPAVHQLDQLGGDREAQPRAAVPARGGGVGLHERAEDLPLLVVRDADAGVAHREPQRRPRRRSARSTVTSTTTSPSSVNLIALPTRLRMIWRRRPASPSSASGTSGAMRQASSSPFCAGARRQQPDAVFDRVAEAERRALERQPAALRSSRSRGCR